MKLTKENVYINLRSKSKEELTDLSIMFDNVNLDGFKYLHFSSEFNEWVHFGYIDCVINKTEVTIEQLKEIIKPMGTFTPIAMKCNKEQFEAIKPKLKGIDILLITDFTFSNYLVNKLGDSEKIISNVNCDSKTDYDRKVHETWNEEIFLKACGIEVETLQQRLEKAEAEVKILKEAIEDSKIKVGDWITFNNGITKGFDKVLSINYSNYNILTQFCCYKGSEYKKITNSQLIELLEQEIK